MAAWGQEEEAVAAAEHGEEEVEVDLSGLIAPWTEEDREKLEKGEMEAGEDLFGAKAEAAVDEGFVMPDLPDLPVVEEVAEEGTEVVSGALLERYFGRRPGRYLFDPQGILQEQVYGDRAGFLDYHAGDSEIDLYVYLFDRGQSPPVEWTPEEVFARHFSRSGLAVVVFYEMERPQRARWAVSPGIEEVIPAKELEEALDEAVDAAFRKSDPADQLDGFCIQLSNRLHWIENTMKTGGEAPGEPGGGERIEAPAVELAGGEAPAAGARGGGSRAGKWWGRWREPGMAAGIVALAALLGLLGRRLAAERRVYRLPEFEVPVSLGAPRGAGVGAVISFSSSRLPPSLQREQVPFES